MSKTNERSSRASRPAAGDTVVISGHRLGQRERLGEILEVLADDGHARYRVRWDDGHESFFYPGSDATIRRPGSRPRPGEAE